MYDSARSNQWLWQGGPQNKKSRVAALDHIVFFEIVILLLLIVIVLNNSNSYEFFRQQLLARSQAASNLDAQRCFLIALRRCVSASFVFGIQTPGRFVKQSAEREMRGGVR